jgi:uncharacterized membrane protein
LSAEHLGEAAFAFISAICVAMQKEYLIELGDAVIAVKDADGRTS